MSEHLLSVEHVGKTFGATRALQDVSFNIAKGSIHSLLGRNGAGKSTVVNIIAGIYAQSSGNVLLEGRDITSLSVSERQRIGIKIVPQHASVVPNLTVGENVFMGVWPRSRSGFVDWTSLHREAAVELARYKLSVSTRVKVGSLNGVDQRKVNIIRAMHGGAKLIILDEPTTALSSDERQELFAFVNELKAQGTAFIFISHYLQEVVELSDEVTVIRDGLAFSGGKKSELQEERLAHLIVGENVELTKREKVAIAGNPFALRCERVSGSILREVSVEMREGEIIGLVH